MFVAIFQSLHDIYFYQNTFSLHIMTRIDSLTGSALITEGGVPGISPGTTCRRPWHYNQCSSYGGNSPPSTTYLIVHGNITALLVLPPPP